MTWSPTTLASLLSSSHLRSLHAQRNRLSGQLPQSLCNATLQLVDLGSNRLTGTLPACRGRGDQSEQPSSSVQQL